MVIEEAAGLFIAQISHQRQSFFQAGVLFEFSIKNANFYLFWLFCSEFTNCINISIFILVSTKLKEQVWVQQPGFGHGSQPSKIEKPLSLKPLLINIIIIISKEKLIWDGKVHLSISCFAD